MPKKVLFISYDGLPYNRLRCHVFSEHLTRLGVPSETFSFRDNLNAPFHGPDSHRTSFFSRLRLFTKAFFHLLKQPSTTVFYVQKAGFHSLAPVISSFFRRNPLILDYDDLEHPSRFSISYIFLWLALRRASCCIAASRFLQGFLSQRTRKTVHYIPGGTDVSAFSVKPPRKSSNFTFVWLGNISDDAVLENLKFLIHAFKKVHHKNPRTRLIIRASGERVGQLEHLLQKSKSIKLISWVEDLPRFLMACHCGVFPLVDKTDYNAAKCPGKVFEYMAAGLPTIATGFGEILNIIDDKSTGLFAVSESDFVGAMLHMANNPEIASGMGKHARLDVAKRFDSSVLMGFLAKVIQNV